MTRTKEIILLAASAIAIGVLAQAWVFVRKQSVQAAGGAPPTQAGRSNEAESPASGVQESDNSTLIALELFRRQEEARHAEFQVRMQELAKHQEDSSVALSKSGSMLLPESSPELAYVSPPLATAAVEKQPDGRPRLIRLFFATSRKAAPPELSEGDKHPRYFSRAQQAGPLTYGVCTVSMPLDRKLPEGEIEGSKFLFIDLRDNPREDVWMHRPKLFPDSAAFFRNLVQDIHRHEQRSVLIGVHGYNNTFEFAGRRLGKMVNDMNYYGTPILYSWPAGDGPQDYGHDVDVLGSGPAEVDRFIDFLAEVAAIARAGGARQIHVVAHSMGNRLLQHAATRLAARADLSSPILDAVVLAAPDVPRAAFAESIWPSLRKVAARCALYISRYDVALFGSERLLMNGQRLGQAGEQPLVLEGLETVDASKADNSFLHHDHHLQTAGICDVAAFFQRLDASQRVSSGLLRKPNVPPGARWFELVAIPSCTPSQPVP